LALGLGDRKPRASEGGRHASARHP
jgi:hypothetical protein